MDVLPQKRGTEGIDGLDIRLIYQQQLPLEMAARSRATLTRNAGWRSSAPAGPPCRLRPIRFPPLPPARLTGRQRLRIRRHTPSPPPHPPAFPPELPPAAGSSGIITYTRAAAAELRQRIAQELGRRMAESPGDRHLQRQLLLVYQADIKTIDSFCTGSTPLGLLSSTSLAGRYSAPAGTISRPKIRFPSLSSAKR